MSNPETAVTVIEPTANSVVVNLDGFPEEQYNRLIPTQVLALGSDLLRPIVQTVQLTPDDTYSSSDLPRGHRAPTKVGLMKLADAAGVDFIDIRRLDDGTNPNVCGVSCYAVMVTATGQMRRAPGSRWLDLGRMSWASDAQRNKFRGHIFEHAETRAMERALRALLSLRQSYPEADLRKPFAVVRVVPNMDHPELRARLLDGMAGSVAALYGPRASAPQLEAGPEVVDVPEAPVDDEPQPAQLTPGRPAAAPVATDTATIAPAVPAPSGMPEAPDWISGATAAPEPAGDSFAARIRSAAADPAAAKGKATKPQLETLVRIFSPLGDGTWQQVLRTGIGILFGEDAIAAPTNAQARAIILAADSDGDFLAHWQELGS